MRLSQASALRFRTPVVAAGGKWLALLLSCIPAATIAQEWKPSRHIEFISASGAGAGSDGAMRAIERTLQETKLINVPSSVINKPGGGGSIGWSWLNLQPADGHQLTLIIGNLLSNQITGLSKLSYNDLTCAAQLFSEFTAIAVRSDSPLTNARDFLARMKADSGALSVAVGTAFGGSGHIALALAAKAAGGEPKKLKAVVFPAFAQALAALYGGHVDLLANPHASFLAGMREGRLRMLAVAAPRRLAGELAAVPTWKETGIDIEMEAFRAMAGPKAMTAPQVAYWEATFRKMVNTDDWKQLLEKRGWADRYAGAEGCKTGLRRQYEQMHLGLSELGLAKN